MTEQAFRSAIKRWQRDLKRRIDELLAEREWPAVFERLHLVELGSPGSYPRNGRNWP